MNLDTYLQRALDAVRQWESKWAKFEHHGTLQVEEAAMRGAFEAYLGRLGCNYPFFHPHYAGQMLKPPHPVAVAGYVAAMLINPNNHALDGGPPTSEMEKEVVRDLAGMFGFPEDALGHLTGGGTVANMEALWVARETHPEKAVAVSDQGHYTHSRMGDVLRMKTIVVPSDKAGRIRLDVLEELVRSGEVGTVVMTAGTTGLGAVDPIADVLEWRSRYGVRIHVDAAYGGFFTLLAGDSNSPLEAAESAHANPPGSRRANNSDSPHAEDTASPLAEDTRRHYRAIADCDSVVVDPHKHGLQPYGCGCVLFRDPSVGRFYKHDSSYTYFTSDDLHLGEISLECSRAGAAAGALWLTLQMIPLRASEGLGPVLDSGLRAARTWYEHLAGSKMLRPYMEPELDILTYFPIPDRRTTAAVDEISQRVFERTMTDSTFLSVLRVENRHFSARHPDFVSQDGSTRILRSVLMKPEHEHTVNHLHERVSEAVRQEHLITA